MAEYSLSEPPSLRFEGLPREQYRRVVNVYPASATDERIREIFEIAQNAGNQTVTGSYDDAGIGALNEKTAVLWDIPVHQREAFIEWYKTHYPCTKIEFAGEQGWDIDWNIDWEV